MTRGPPPPPLYFAPVMYVFFITELQVRIIVPGGSGLLNQSWIPPPEFISQISVIAQTHHHSSPQQRPNALSVCTSATAVFPV